MTNDSNTRKRLRLRLVPGAPGPDVLSADLKMSTKKPNLANAGVCGCVWVGGPAGKKKKSTSLSFLFSFALLVAGLS